MSLISLLRRKQKVELPYRLDPTPEILKFMANELGTTVEKLAESARKDPEISVRPCNPRDKYYDAIELYRHQIDTAFITANYERLQELFPNQDILVFEGQIVAHADRWEELAKKIPHSFFSKCQIEHIYEKGKEPIYM